MKIGIITFEFNFNYGAILQATALRDYLRLQGHTVKIINRGWGPLTHNVQVEKSKASHFNSLASELLGRYFSLKSLLDFKRRHWTLTTSINKEYDYKNVYSEFDVIITGSDQIWNSACIPTMGLHYYGINADSERQKLIAYAPSFGKNRFEATDEQIDILREHLKKFVAISVREQDGIEILKNRFDYNYAIRVLDPTMLMNKKYYLKDIAGLKKVSQKKTLAYYLLDKTPEKLNYINQVAKRTGLKPVNLYLPDNNGIPIIGKLKSLKYPSVEKWLKRIAEADLVITDSFHGTVFSILFNKDFITFGNNSRGNSRFDNLLSIFGLTDRLLTSYEDFSLESSHIDYNRVNQVLSVKRKESESFLLNALK